MISYEINTNTISLHNSHAYILLFMKAKHFPIDDGGQLTEGIDPWHIMTPIQVDLGEFTLDRLFQGSDDGAFMYQQTIAEYHQQL